MSWAVISAEGINSRLSTAVVEVLRRTCSDVAAVYHGTRAGAAEPISIHEAGPPVVAVEAGPEGLGYFLNSCIEASRSLDDSIEWFLVLTGNDLDPARSMTDILAGITKALETQLLVWGLGTGQSRPTSEDLLEAAARRQEMLLAGAGGFMVIRKEAWLDVSGFREDVGSGGTELHFALDTLGHGKNVLIMPCSGDPQGVRSKKASNLVAALVAFGTFGRELSMPSKLGFLVRSVWPEHLIYPKALVRKIHRAREVLRTREFLESGR